MRTACQSSSGSSGRYKVPLHASARLLSSSSECSDEDDLQQLQLGGAAVAFAVEKKGFKRMGFKGLLRSFLLATCFCGAPAT